jgi:hypothetical protein
MNTSITKYAANLIKCPHPCKSDVQLRMTLPTTTIILVYTYSLITGEHTQLFSGAHSTVSVT